CARRPFDYW
nr:immunoglobulin heavy chain junction region [Mus musculus]MBK4184116.1 immunoglobulin heavy chain junction region [Mus musculus]MBK4184117.1 immunoglobulin heavy chain junction region [Mus musculus]MBK4184119.1 immunoglobulin heavy chain junction region [Mus musculus]MBK4184120.1 immunoglobulin heavy chain junction region [Mus musculus]